MKIISTVDELVRLRSIPDLNITRHQELLKVVISIGIVLGAILSENMLIFFKAKSKWTSIYCGNKLCQGALS